MVIIRMTHKTPRFNHRRMSIGLICTYLTCMGIECNTAILHANHEELQLTTTQ